MVRVFRHHLHDPDVEGLYAVLAAVVGNRCDGDPVWLLLVAPPSAGKTELVMPLGDLPDVRVAGRLTVASLLSGTSAKERAADATGGLLCQIGERGILVNKDFGTVLAMPRDPRSEVLQALRDIYDGHYDRPLGTDGGRILEWDGHCGFIAGCTSAIDSHHAVVAALGDRYVMLRLRLTDADAQAIRALEGVGDEEVMRRELSQALAGILDHAPTELPALSDEDRLRLARLAALAVRCRSIVERDGYSRDIISVPPPEQPARIAKQLGKLLAALRAIGCGEPTSWCVATRCALDSMPAGRLAVLRYLAGTELDVDTGTIGEGIGLPTTSARRHLEDLEAHRVIERERQGEGKADRWRLAGWTRERWPTVPEMSEPMERTSVSLSDRSKRPMTSESNFSGTPLDDELSREVTTW